MSLYPTGTIVRFTFGPLNIFEDISVRPLVLVEDPKAVMGKAVVWAGGEGIYVRPISPGSAWHLVMTERGDVPVISAMIESHPNYREKNKALETSDVEKDPAEIREDARVHRLRDPQPLSGEVGRDGDVPVPLPRPLREVSLSPPTISAIDNLAHSLRMEVDDLRDDEEFVADDENLLAWLDALETMALGLDKLPVRMEIELRPIEEDGDEGDEEE